MRPARLIARGLAFHAPAHLATLLGVAVAAAVLAGALILGDSVRASLARARALRLGALGAVVGSGERFFGADLAERLAARAPELAPVSVIQLPAVAARADGSRRIADAQLLGVSGALFGLAPEPFVGEPAPGAAWVGHECARALALAAGDELVLRVSVPSATSRELALASVEDAIRPLRVRVTRVLANEELGALALDGGAAPRANLFVARDWLAERLGVPGRANRLFVPAGAPETREALRAAFTLDDVGLTWREREGCHELASDQVFLADALVEALRGLEPPPLALLGYFVNGLTKGARTTPYSTVAALGALDARAGPDFGGWRAALGGLGPQEIVLNEWTARDLDAAVGDEVVLSYFVLGPGRALEERTHAFRVRSVLPMAGLGADPTLSPEFPGIGDAENCRDWDPGLPLELERLRDEDEQYWDEHRGAPKAFVSLASAQSLWGNRFGALTALRFAPEQTDEVLARLRTLDPGELGLPLRSLERAAAPTTDFGALFLGLSGFLVGSALLLAALFFGFSVERRAAELGVLRVTGFSPLEVARLQLGEACGVCVLGAALGVGLGLVYTRLLLHLLATLWRGAVGRTELVLHIEPATLGLAFGLAVVLGLASVALVVRRALRVRPLALLAGELAADRPGQGRTRARRLVLGLAALAALVASAGALGAQGAAAGALGFVAGFAALVAGLCAVRELLARPAPPSSVARLGWTNAARRPARSLTTVALVASAVFLLVVAGANRQGPAARAAARDSASGGFGYLGRTSLPILHDLESAEGRAFYGLDEAELAGAELVPLRVRAGDEASCLNLDRPTSPRLFGVPPAAMAGRFRFAATARASPEPWTLLEDELEDGAVPVIVDALSLQWTLHARLGDALELSDARGRPFRARVVATLAESILQGDVLLAEERFEALFPDEVGHRGLLVAAPPERAEALAARLSRALADEGLELVPTHERLDLLRGVQNTYLAIFQALGGLGLVLGSAGLLALVLRQALERRGELALLRALGYGPRELRLLFLGEQGGLVWVGLSLGALAGLCVVLPRLGPESLGALGALVLLLVAVGLTGTGFVWLGARAAPRAALLAALQRE